jgi:hypothetical protein
MVAIATLIASLAAALALPQAANTATTDTAWASGY